MWVGLRDAGSATAQLELIGAEVRPVLERRVRLRRVVGEDCRAARHVVLARQVVAVAIDDDPFDSVISETTLSVYGKSFTFFNIGLIALHANLP